MKSNPFDLSGKRIVVTGSTSGIGKQIAETCAEMGASLFLIGRNESKLEETFKGLKGEGHVTFKLNYNDVELDLIALEESLKGFGLLDGVVHCAGVTSTLPMNSINEQRINEIFRTNTIVPILLTKHFVKKGIFNDNGGSIVFISSVMSEVGEIAKTLYSSSKGAITSAVKSMSLELARKNIRVNSISPGVVLTPMVENGVYAQNQENFDRVKSLHPLGLGQPEDIGNGCIYLLSDGSRWVTGINLIIDGGYCAH